MKLKAQLNVSMVIVSLGCFWELCRHLLNNFWNKFPRHDYKATLTHHVAKDLKTKVRAQNGFYWRTQYFILSSLAKSTLCTKLLFSSPLPDGAWDGFIILQSFFCNFFPWRFRSTRRQRSPEVQHGRLHTTWHTNTN